MIIHVLSLDDDLADFYLDEAQARKLDLKVVLVDRLKRAGQLDPRERYVILSGKDRERLETLLGGLPIQSPEDLIAKVNRLARIKFGDWEIELTPGQKEEIARMAGKQSKSVGRVIQEMWELFVSEFFVRLPVLK